MIQKSFNLLFIVKTNSNNATLEDEQQDSIDEEIKAEIKRFLATENFNAETKEDLYHICINK